ncbi:hypothetical protein GCM10010523_13730 [Paenarthrobacter ilicis]
MDQQIVQAGRGDVILQDFQRHGVVPAGELQFLVCQGTGGGPTGRSGCFGVSFDVVFGHGTAAFYWKLNAAECRST